MRTSGLVAVLLVVGTVPIVSAFHLSIGAQDNVGVAAVESTANPSVPATSNLFRIGTGATPCTRYEPTGDGVSAGALAADATTVVAAHPFCKRLVYNFGTPQETVSPVDQHFPLNAPGDVWRFDSVASTYVGSYGLSTNAITILGGGYIIINNQGQAQGLWPDNHNYICAHEVPPGSTSCGWQEYAVNFNAPSATIAAQNLVRTLTGQSIAEGDGWQFPVYDQTHTGFLTNNGVAVNQFDLRAKVAAYVAAGRLPAAAQALVCGFMPEPGVSVESSLADAFGSCEMVFQYKNEHPGTWDYQDPCTSPAYFCGTIGGGAWYAYTVCSFAISGCAAGGSWDSTRDYDMWHFVVAPSLSACYGRAEPGFLTLPQGNAQAYIAHDLDIHSPIGSSVAKTGTDDVGRFANYYADQVDPRTTNDVGKPLVRKDNNLEPNAVGDTSATVTQARTSAHPCAPLINGPPSGDPNDANDSDWKFAQNGLNRPGRSAVVETAFDPWVNYVDSRISLQNGGVPGIGTLVAVNGAATTFDAYATTAGGQDASNRPGNGFARFSGKIGAFADADDDFIRADAEDEYEGVPFLLSGTSDDPWERILPTDPVYIESIGAYPFFFDTWQDLSGRNPANARSCKPDMGGGLPSGTSLSDAMAQAGYDVTRTGMIQVVYASLPMIAYPLPIQTNADIVAPAVHSAGTALVFMSQGLHESRTHGSTADQAFVAGLIASAIAKLPVTPAGTVVARDGIVFGTSPARLTSYQSDFNAQCNLETGLWSNRWVLTHICDGRQVLCNNDTVVTGYTFRLNTPIGSAAIPAPPLSLGTGVQHMWWDVDPFDNNAARNTP